MTHTQTKLDQLPSDVLDEQQGSYAGEALLRCPNCGFDYTHPDKVEQQPARNVGISVTISGWCESCDDRWQATFRHHEGNTYLSFGWAEDKGKGAESEAPREAKQPKQMPAVADAVMARVEGGEALVLVLDDHQHTAVEQRASWETIYLFDDGSTVIEQDGHVQRGANATTHNTQHGGTP